MKKQQPAQQVKSITFYHPWAFYSGVTALIVGVFLHLPDYIHASEMEYRMVGMAMSNLMWTGMALIVLGIAFAAYGLIPRKGEHVTQPDAGLSVQAMDDAPLTAAHWKLVATLFFVLVVDFMKPTTLAFVMPGAKEEYGLTTEMITLLPFVAMIGLVFGAIVWGLMADRLGRRPTILLATLIFIGTSICGSMPDFRLNLMMCFIMGVSAGGMLPIVFALLSEMIPAQKRGWMTVLIAGLGTAGGYLVASVAAALLEPQYSWRILWLLGFPSGIMVIFLNRYLPESPRFLISHGKTNEAHRVMENFGVIIKQQEGSVKSSNQHKETASVGVGHLFKTPFLSQTIVLGLYGLTWGLVNWGFLTWLPTILRDMGLDARSANTILAWSSVISIPATLPVAWLYAKWSTKKSLVLFALLTAAALAGLATLDISTTDSSGLLTVLIVLLLMSRSGVIAMFTPYSAELYPTRLRGIGTGIAVASTKLGGILGPPLIGAVLVASPGLTAASLVVSVPIFITAILLGKLGIETRGRSLEEIHAT